MAPECKFYMLVFLSELIVTSLTLGHYFDPPLEFSYEKAEIPRDLIEFSIVAAIDGQISSTLPWANVRSRRNF